jgi:hypothetical protein
MKGVARPIVRLWSEKLPAFDLIEIEGQAASRAWSLETVQKWKRQEPWLKTSIRNQGRDEAGPLIFPVNRHLCSSPAIAVFGPEAPASSPSDSDISALAARRRLVPASSHKPSGKQAVNLLPHENELFNKFLHPIRKELKHVVGMNRKKIHQRSCAKAIGLKTEIGGQSKIARQITHRCPQRFGNFHKRVHRRRFLSAFDTTDENRRKTSLFSQFFLTELDLSSLNPNCFAQKAAMLAGRHDHSEDRKWADAAMSLTTSFACVDFAGLLQMTAGARNFSKFNSPSDQN